MWWIENIHSSIWSLLFATVFASTRPGLLLVNWNRWKIYTMSRPWPYFSSSDPFYYFRPFWRGSGCTSRALVYNYSLQNLCGIGETHPWFSTLIRGTKQAKSSSLTNRRRCCSWLPASNKSSPWSAVVLQKSWICTDILEEKCWIWSLLQKSNLNKPDMNRPWLQY